jgi:PadR family transcriptional regulator PadR
MDKNYIGGSSNLLVLSLISRKDMYGYEIIKELEILSDKSFQFKEGTLYPILHKFENMGWIDSYAKISEIGKERKYYRITTLGTKQLNEEQAKWEEFKNSVMKVLNGQRYVAQS